MPEAKKILIFEDHPEIQMILQVFFRKRGYEPIVAGDGVDAVELVRKHGPALIIMDIIMPGKDGIEACQDIRASGIQTPVIFLTSKAYAEDKERGLAAGGNAFLLKPFNSQKLDAAMRPYLG